MITKDQLIDVLLSGWHEQGKIGRARYEPSVDGSFMDFLRVQFGEGVFEKKGAVEFPSEETGFAYLWDSEGETMYDGKTRLEPDFVVGSTDPDFGEVALYMLSE